jgi:hypothetical protein
VPAQQRLHTVLAVAGAEQATVDQVGQRGHDVVVAATAEGDDLADRALAVDEREQRPLVAAELRIVRRRAGEAQHCLRRRDRRGDRAPALEPPARLGDDLIDLTRDADVVRVGLVHGEGELAVGPAQQIEDGVHDVLGDHVVQHALVDRTGLLHSACHTDGVVRGSLLDRGLQGVVGHVTGADEAASESLTGHVRRATGQCSGGQPDDTVRPVTAQVQPARLLRHAEQSEDVREAEGVE